VNIGSNVVSVGAVGLVESIVTRRRDPIVV
jgi:hypothetical protein